MNLTKSYQREVPQNTSLLQSTKYSFVIPDLPFARYFCQSVSLPGISTSAVTIPTPFSETYRHGDKLAFEPFKFTFIIDEDMRVWEESYAWLIALTFPRKFAEYERVKGRKIPKYYDGILTLNTNANLPNIFIKFRNCHPVSLGGITLSTADSADTTLIADMELRYDYFDIERSA